MAERGESTLRALLKDNNWWGGSFSCFGQINKGGLQHFGVVLLKNQRIFSALTFYCPKSAEIQGFILLAKARITPEQVPASKIFRKTFCSLAICLKEHNVDAWAIIRFYGILSVSNTEGRPFKSHVMCFRNLKAGFFFNAIVASSALQSLLSPGLSSSRWNKCQVLCSSDVADVWTEFQNLV